MYVGPGAGLQIPLGNAAVTLQLTVFTPAGIEDCFATVTQVITEALSLSDSLTDADGISAR